MEGSQYRKTGWLIALSSAALLSFGVNGARADFLLGAVSSEETAQTPGLKFVPYGSALRTKVSHAREDGRAVLQGLRYEWESLRSEMARAAVTMFFIRGGTTPNTPPPGGNGNPPPPGQNNQPPGGDGNPPPPGGQGETPPGNPGAPPGTPEPASFVLALLGAGLATGCGWRQRRRAVCA
jgi:hypothetical protein